MMSNLIPLHHSLKQPYFSKRGQLCTPNVRLIFLEDLSNQICLSNFQNSSVNVVLVIGFDDPILNFLSFLFATLGARILGARFEISFLFRRFFVLRFFGRMQDLLYDLVLHSLKHLSLGRLNVSWCHEMGAEQCSTPTLGKNVESGNSLHLGTVHKMQGTAIAFTC